MIQVDDIRKSYGNLEVLKGISLSVGRAEVLCLMGASGAGKSTLLHIMGTLDVPDSGRVLMDGEDLFAMNAKRLAAFRNRHIGFIFQFHHLLPEFTALENICLPAWIAGRPRREAEKEAMGLLEMFRLTERAQHKPHELSGGEQQRVAVARALINHPSVVLADEQFGHGKCAGAAPVVPAVARPVAADLCHCYPQSAVVGDGRPHPLYGGWPFKVLKSF